MNRTVLVVEDNNHKRDRITTFIRDGYPNIILDEAHSFSSGCKCIMDREYSAVILDISLPTYDKTGAETGGRNRPFGGREIARKIMRRGIRTKILFITQYDSFSDEGRSHSLSSLSELLKQECAENFIGLIQYDSSKSAWKEKLSEALNKVVSL